MNGDDPISRQSRSLKGSRDPEMVNVFIIVLVIFFAILVVGLGFIIIRALGNIANPDPDPPPPSPKELSSLPSRSTTVNNPIDVTVALWSIDTTKVYLADKKIITLPRGQYTSESLATTLNKGQPLILIDKFKKTICGAGFQLWFDGTATRKYSMIVKRLNTGSVGSYIVTLDAPPSIITTLSIDGVSPIIQTALIQLPIGKGTIYKYRRVDPPQTDTAT